MKPIHLNLAARPYRDYRPVYATVVVLSLLTAFLMLNNIETYYRYIHETKSTRAKIAQVEEQARLEAERERSARERLQRFDSKRLAQQTEFINAQLAERAFSWSRLLDELESVVPDDVRLVSVTPSFTPDGRIMLNLGFEAKSPDGMIVTINRLNADPQFVDAFPSTETEQEGGEFSFNLSAQYRPESNRIARTAGVAR